MKNLSLVSAKFDSVREMLFFLAKLNLFAVPLYAMLLLDVQFAALQSATRDITFYLLNVLGLSPSASGYLISIPIQNGNWAALINWDCTGWKSLLAFAALVFATGRPLKNKVHGLAVFLPLIFAVNIARIIFMFLYVRTFDIAYYQFVHAMVWSWGMIFVILLSWVVWMKFMK